jgi:hypothetical protein
MAAFKLFRASIVRQQWIVTGEKSLDALMLDYASNDFVAKEPGAGRRRSSSHLPAGPGRRSVG